jgi:adenylate cyclase
VGPAAAARCDASTLRPLGVISVRGRDEALAVFEPWPENMPAEWRQSYSAAFTLIDSDPPRAAALFDELAARAPGDPVTHLIAKRLRARMIAN